MVLSESASYDDAVSKYAWMKYKGPRGKEVSQRTHKRMIRDGDTFGILPLRNGGRYTLIFPDMPHVDFPLDKATGLFLIERASKLRKVPDVVKRESRTKVAGAQTLARRVNRVTFDAARYQPKSVKSEATNGVDLANYQWRMVPNNDYPVKTSKGPYKFYKNDMIGVRFLRQGKGGVVINTEGMYLKVDDAQYDLLVHDTNILPIADWPQGIVDVDTIKKFRKVVRRTRRRSQEEQEEAARLARNAAVLEQKQQRKELQKEARKKAQERSAEMRDLRNKVKSGEIEAPKAQVRTVYEDQPDLNRRGKARAIEHEELEEELQEDIDFQLDLDEQKLEDVLGRSPFSGDMFNIEDTIGSLFGGDDSEDLEAPELDLSDIDEPEEDEEDTPPPKVRAKGKKPAPEPEEDSDEEQDSDVAAAEKEANATAKKIAAENKSTPENRATDAEEGDVLRFKADTKLQRDWLILNVSTHNASDNIVVYTVYDITNSPEEVRKIRINRARKQNLFDYAEHVKDMAPKLFNRVLDMAEDFPVNKDPIAS